MHEDRVQAKSTEAGVPFKPVGMLEQRLMT
jgi:hypothetical protein